MSAMLPPQHDPLAVPQRYASQYGEYSPASARTELEQSKVLIRGDIILYITESEAALGPITGCYSIEATGMQELLYIFWHAEGQVHCRHARSTAIEFDVRGARAGETRTYLVAAQVAESGVQGRVVQCGVFVQIRVSEDPACKTHATLLRQWADKAQIRVSEDPICKAA
jgi:hypothetical protein